MVSPLLSGTQSTATGSASVSASDLYTRVSKTLQSQNAGVKALGAALGRDKAVLSGLGQLQNALADFAALTQTLTGAGVQTGASVSNSRVLGAVTNTAAQSGTHTVDVTQLAQGQVLSTDPRKTQTTPIGAGTSSKIVIDTGHVSGASFAANPGSAKTLTVDASNNTLQGIAAALKAAGVDASVVKSGAGYALTLTAPPGSANSLRVSVSGDASVQKLLNFNPLGAQNLAQTRAPRDALFNIDGTAHTSSDNVVVGALAGVTLSLKSVGSTSVAVSQDPAQIGKNVNAFVGAYNTLNAKLRTLQQGGLKDDGVLGQVGGELAATLKNAGTSALAKAGISIDASGDLHIDDKALQGALAADPQAVAGLFSNQGKGIADQLGARIAKLNGSNGTIVKKHLSIDHDMNSIATQQTALNKALSAQASAQVAQYASAGASDPGQSGGHNSLFDYIA